MKIDKNLKKLPLTKSNPKTLEFVFGNEGIEPMWVADMDFQISTSIQDALIQRIYHSGFGYEYKPESFFIAQKKWYKKHYNINLNKEHILYSTSISSSISILIENLTVEKNGVIIQPPVFMEFRQIIRSTKRNVINNPLTLRDNSYQLNFDDLEEKAAEQNTKILIICNPHNPVGRVWTKEELKKIVEICKKNELTLISDEIHKDIILFNNQFTSALQFINDYENIIVCTSEAKTFNLCGISDSMAIIPNEQIKKSISKTFHKYNLGRTNALTRVALETAYNHGGPWLEEVIKTIENNGTIILLTLSIPLTTPR